MSIYLRDKVASAEKELPIDLYRILHNDASLMAALGVESDTDYNDFFIISSNIKRIATELSGKDLSEDDLSRISCIIYNNRDECPVNNMYRLYKAAGKAMEIASIKKVAYPQGYGFAHIQPPHNINDWVQTVREIYATAYQKQIDLNKAFDIVTEKWNTMDKLDFKHWLSFHQSNDHLKYKIAAEPPKYYQVGEGAVIPASSLRSRIPGLPSQIQGSEEEEANKSRLEAERKQQTELTAQQSQDEMKKKLIGRLTAAERVYTANVDAFRKMLGAEYERWLAVLHDLKRKIQIAMPVNAKSSLFEDLIIKEANRLKSEGFVRSSMVIRKFAQEAAVAPPPVGGGAPVTPPDLPPDLPTDPAADLQPPTDMDLGMVGGTDDNPDAAMEEFVRNLTGEVDDNKANDGLFAKAQAAEPPAETPAEPVKEQPKVEISDDDISRVLQNVTLEDVITDLDRISQDYRNREKIRQLTIVDLKMQQLGIASYFPELAEAINKGFDSNQYILTRVEDILSRLRGAAGPNIHENLEKAKDIDEQKLIRKNLPVEEPPPGQAPGQPAELAAPAKVEAPPPPVPVR